MIHLFYNISPTKYNYVIYLTKTLQNYPQTSVIFWWGFCFGKNLTKKFLAILITNGYEMPIVKPLQENFECFSV